MKLSLAHERYMCPGESLAMMIGKLLGHARGETTARYVPIWRGVAELGIPWPIRRTQTKICQPQHNTLCRRN